ncbi:hypothetical protein ACFY05_31980 [Microtetraspora fusca]|uniref:Uncharacterized protein n=1 Tax=Microtetraspora fusca TaxID=1997 RepID=A0ABW6VDQ2_MICFU
MRKRALTSITAIILALAAFATRGHTISIFLCAAAIFVVVHHTFFGKEG